MTFFYNTITAANLANAIVSASFNGTTNIVKLRVSLIVCDENINTFLKLRVIQWVPNATTFSYCKASHI